MAKEKKLKASTKIDVSGDKPAKKAQKTREVSRGMPVEKDSYIIVKVGTKNFLCLAINPERGRAVIDATLIDDEPKTIEYDEQNLVAVLGTKPKPGSAYGVKINPYISSVETKYGPIHFYRELNEREMKSFKKALKSTYTAMVDNHMNVFPFSAMRVYPKRGKYAGQYEIRRKGTEIWDRVDLFPETFEDPQWNEYLLYHEYGHAVWYKMVESRTKARWIKMFHKRIELTNFLKERLESLLDECLNYQDGNLKDFMKELDDESKLVFKEVLAHYKKYHKLDGKSLAILFSEDSEKFASMWPKRSTVVESKMDPSDYALTKPEEFFAECFAFHMQGRKMSSDIVKLMEKTLIQIKGQ